PRVVNRDVPEIGLRAVVATPNPPDVAKPEPAKPGATGEPAKPGATGEPAAERHEPGRAGATNDAKKGAGCCDAGDAGGGSLALGLLVAAMIRRRLRTSERGRDAATRKRRAEATITRAIVVAAVLAAPSTTDAFCGFYVSPGEQPMFA